MSIDINSVFVIGRLVRDAEIRYTQGGTAIAKFTLAQNHRRKTGEQWVDEGHFFDAVIMGKSAEGVHPYLKKGQQVGVNGELRQNKWETPEGEKRSRVEIFAHQIQLLGGKKDQTDDGAAVDFDDDVPF